MHLVLLRHEFEIRPQFSANRTTVVPRHFKSAALPRPANGKRPDDDVASIILTNLAPFGDAFVAKYNSSGVIQWAQSAGGTNGGLYWAIALDGQTNVYPAGVFRFPSRRCEI